MLSIIKILKSYKADENILDIYKLYLSEAEMTAMESNPNWYNEQTFARKKALYQKWLTLYNNSDYASIKDFLWPWNEHFDIKPGGNQTIIVTTPETLRLINYRTEFQLKENMNNDDVVDPFIFETLRQPNSY